MTGADRKADKGANDKYLGDPGRLSTESVRPELGELDLLDAAELVGLMLSDARRATDALSGAAPAITAAVELVRERLASGGRLVYVGAGTAGRLAVLDAAELGPTFSVPDGIVTAVLAGGEEALRRAVEGAEDDGPGGRRPCNASKSATATPSSASPRAGVPPMSSVLSNTRGQQVPVSYRSRATGPAR